MSKKILRKFMDFAILAVYILAIVGGVSYLLYYDQPIYAVLEVVLAGMAFPFVKKYAKDLADPYNE